MDLAAALHRSEHNLHEVKDEIERLLTALFPSWQTWEFVSPDGIEVWQAIDSSRGATMLHRHGFTSVILHGHRAARFLLCQCKPREVPR